MIKHFIQYWSLYMALSTILLGGLALPSRSGELIMVDTDKMVTFFTSPVILTPLFLTIVTLYWAKLVGLNDLKLSDRSLAIWALSNAYFWSSTFDVCSGFFGVTPNLNEHYITIDVKHLSPLGREINNEPALTRSGLDAVYLSEMCLHVPLSFLVFYCYVTKKRSTKLLESFVSGVQLMGTIAYYLPEILDGSKSYPEGGVSLYFGVYFGLLWVFFPLGLLCYNLYNAENSDSGKVKSE
eukprot:TRINITY_DN10250_c0_g1_i1.p1 TRINITY_DN10250_c0_g1~~TRINITY_DN10250_c0_g1_i1.p1  ORF type:complete len:239 (-),score=22.59 TRINITY_DN10250_c0_g1_i1:19-735(-)